MLGSDRLAQTLLQGNMMRIDWIRSILLCCLSLLTLASAAGTKTSSMEDIATLKKAALLSEPAPLIPRDVFNQQPVVGDVLLAPNGLSLAYTKTVNNNKQLWLFDILKGEHKKLISASSFKQLGWTGDSRSLVYIDQKRLISVDSQAANKAGTLYQFSDKNTRFVKMDSADNLSFWLYQYSPSSGYYSISKTSAKEKPVKVFESEVPIMDLWEQDGTLQFVSVLVDNAIEIKKIDDKTRDTVLRCGQSEPCHIRHWNAEAGTLLISGYFQDDLLSLFAVNISSDTKTLIHQDPEGRFDLSHVHITPAGQAQIVGYISDYYENYGLVGDTQTLLANVKQTLNSPVLRLSSSRDQNTWLITDAGPMHAEPKHHIYVRDTNTWISPLAHLHHESMKPEWIAPRIPIQYAASDGMRLQGYLTLPFGADASDVPLVTVPHGGPWTRTTGTFSRFAQFLANRGYAVFEPNFRGSTGFGKNYLLSANRDFGNGRVQQDILDGIDFLLGQGIGNADKLALVGHSFGGFSSLVGLAFTPERFNVAFAGAAPNNLAKTINYYLTQMPALLSEQRQSRYGHLMVDVKNAKDVRRLSAQSPDLNWQGITQPLYMWAGAKDDRVAIEDVKDFALRLHGAGKPVSLVSDAREGHNPESIIARDAYLYMLEHALAKHIKGRHDSNRSSQLDRYLKKFLIIDSNGVLENTKH